MEKDIRLGNGGPPGLEDGAAAGWRAVTRVLRSCAQAIGGTVATAYHDALNLVYPSDCRACGVPVLRSGRVLICEACTAGVSAQSCGELCSRCGEAMGVESARISASLGITECVLCRMAPPEFTRAVAFGPYEGSLREMLHLTKFSRQRETAQHLLGNRLAQAVQQLRLEASSELRVVPVPLHFERERQRGFNQAELLARAAIHALKKLQRGWRLQLAENVLVRTKPTPPLYSLNPSQRRSRVRGAFAVIAPERVRGCEVLLIDDIMTTGATTRECARVLRHAGATKVWVATVAKAQPQSIAVLHEVIEPSGLPAGVALWDGSNVSTMH
ncbi:MAG: ComF family protein [Acidobacteriaceae bacterium]|nr:ComF family protein [Acidobacteriaceae bacterium]